VLEIVMNAMQVQGRSGVGTIVRSLRLALAVPLLSSLLATSGCRIDDTINTLVDRPDVLVVDERGRPMAGVLVLGIAPSQGEAEARTDEAGGATLPFSAGDRSTIKIQMAGYGFAEAVLGDR
jgi:hypothetical protein